VRPIVRDRSPDAPMHRRAPRPARRASRSFSGCVYAPATPRRIAISPRSRRDSVDGARRRLRASG
jgi:hypothetical protein